MLTYFTRFSTVSIVDFEQVNVSWVDEYQLRLELRLKTCYTNTRKGLGIWSELPIKTLLLT